MLLELFLSTNRKDSSIFSCIGRELYALFSDLLYYWHFGILVYAGVGAWKGIERCCQFFSGALIPLWFFPDKLRRISEILPFQHIYFSPISIFTGTANGSDIMKILFMQWVWILIFYCIGKMIWNYAVQKITVLGG